ncbi:MAG: methionine adenosyltransferase [Candidatus Aenigmarchaeota archaeon]|nr:methionine adenosyltransferase [Candidatus Aenigmarchaeota archaeon]
MQLFIEELNQKPVCKQKIEIVERKGIGHPDSLIDAICEASSRVLSQYYIDKKGFICHHNLDKGLISSGSSNPVFGGGSIIESPDVIVSGQATVIQNIDDIKKVIYEEVDKYLDRSLRFADVLNPGIIVKIHPGSADLVGLFERFKGGEMPLANDTSFGVGFAPMSELENTVYRIEQLLNSEKTKKKFPFIGEDIKVMGSRNDDQLNLTVAIAFVSQFVPSLEEYYNQKEKTKELIEKNIKTDKKLKINVNAADSKNCVYLTVTGTSCECGDAGQVGRGNRANGLITPCRTMSLEAVAGKNPISHVGKIYNLKAQEIANKISNIFNVQEVQVQLLSEIGKPINNPFIGIKYIPDGNFRKNEVEQIVSESLSKEGFDALTEKLLKGSISVF